MMCSDRRLCVSAQAARFDKEASQRISAAGSTSIEVVAAMFREYAQRIAFGYCPPHKAHFVTLTYAQVWERIKVGRPYFSTV